VRFDDGATTGTGAVPAKGQHDLALRQEFSV
jgi:hypothetical protein